MFCIFALYMCFTCHAETVSQRGNNTNIASSARNKQTTETKRKTDTISRSVETPKKNISSARTAVKEKVGVTQRTNSQITQKQKNITPRSATRTSTTKVTARTATNNNNTNRKQLLTRTNKTKISRAGEINTNAIEQIKSKDLTKCKTVYYDCMDEFCANKDSSLRRCACSSKVHDFDKAKKKLEQFEDKMLDFNKQLLTVSMDKEDAAVINTATEGELAANTKDTSESQKILNKITDALNSNGKNKFNTNLSSISLSLNEDAVWDNIDLNSGVSTTTKEGVDLYNAVLPMCEEMTLEICSQDDLEIIKSNYLLSIEQDCNTVAKSYESKYNQAKDKVYESSSLLDMSRLTVYQDKNSDDILTCRKKMLEQLSDINVCGKDLYKCLDISGNYINPATGEAVLTENLYNLTNLIKEPSANETWQNINKGSQFIRFLTSKKTFLESAMSNCEDVKDIVWDDFINDALAKIKLAQNSKLDEIRQSCTTLLAECSTKSMTDLTEFDPRAISTFAVSATLTTQAMCSNISNSCSALMNYLDTNNTITIAEADWVKGIHGVQTNITLDSIYQNCLLVGQACVVDNCSGIAGDFTQCNTTDNQSTEQRDIILSKSSCWQDVTDCVAQAETMIEENIVPTISYNGTYATSTEYILGTDFYTQQYNEYNETDIQISCKNDCTNSYESVKCAECLIAETIWGNCANNEIIKPKNKTTILSWFGTNTNLGCKTSTISKIHYYCSIKQTSQQDDDDSLYTKQLSDNISTYFIKNLQDRCSLTATTELKICSFNKQQNKIANIDKCTSANTGTDIYVYPFLSCPVGYKYNTEEQTSTDTEKNYKHECVQCEAGTYQDKEGQASCTSCENGTYQDKPGQTSCIQCGAGYYCDGKSKETCTAGYYCDGKSKVICTAGYYCDGKSKETCTAGYYCKDGKQKASCRAGYYCPANSDNLYTEEIQCKAGTYQDKQGQTSCNQCKAGTYQDKQGQTSCNQCPIGNFCPEASSSPIPCSQGYYQDKTGQASCIQCPANSTCSGTGNTTFTCNSGYYKTEGNNTHCEGNKYTVKYDGNGETSGTMGSHSCTYGHTCTLSENKFTKTGFIFTGWSLYSSTSGILYADKECIGCGDNENYTGIKPNNGQVVSVYAQWKAETK